MCEVPQLKWGQGKRRFKGNAGDREREYVGVWVCGCVGVWGGMRNAEKLKN
jgi:hypothetical protein